MRVPLSWLREHANVPAADGAKAVAATLVRVGLEEEGWDLAEVSGPVVVGQVLSAQAEPQRNGKTINWCQVDVGEPQARGIVCGAHNFGPGDKVVVALPGSVLAGDFAINARKTYGHVSDGMICSARELGLGDDHTGILVLSRLGLGEAADTARPGDDAVVLLGLDDEVVDVNVTPDRGYCLCIRGVAREYALAGGGSFRDPADVPVPASDADGWPVRVEDPEPVREVPGCDRYVARLVRGVNASAPSPYWMQHRLHQAGMRSISLAVDVTNYVMLATGQPLHAFDAAKLRGPIVVRRARPGETLTTLDGVDRRLHGEDLLITDEDPDASGPGASRVLALAGVMGGAETEVVEQTRDILLESAHFAAVSVARSARRHKLVSEAGRRFERGVDPALAPHAAELAVRLLVELGGGEVAAVTDLDHTAPPAPIRFRPGAAGELVGVAYSDEQVAEVLHGIGCQVDSGNSDPRQPAAQQAGADGAWVVTPPSWRPDLTRPVDLIEEVARVQGYDAIPSLLPTAPAGSGLTASQRARSSVSRALAEQGYVEVLSYPFIGAEVFDAFGLPDDDDRRHALGLANPISDEQPLLRTMLLQTLLPTLRRNISRGIRDIGLFEVGLVTRPGAGESRAPMFAVGRRPSDEDLATLLAAVPAQPRRLAVVLAGEREPTGWWGSGRSADWADAIEAVRTVATTLRVPVRVRPDADHAPWHPGRCARVTLADGTLVGHAGELHPRVVAALELPARTCAAEVDLDVLVAAAPARVPAEPLSTFPAAYQDVALVVDAGVPAADVAAALAEGAGPALESVRLFDRYAGEQLEPGKVSLAYRLRFRAPDRTLTGEEVSAAREAAVALTAARLGATQR